MPFTLRSIWLSAGALVAGTLAVARFTGLSGPAALAPAASRPPTPPARPAPPRKAPAVADSVVAVGLRLRGTEYQTGGTTPTGGFDCSGFVRYCFAQLGVAVPPSSTLQARTGRAVPRAQARPGDIVIFTGTDAGQRTPGHTGIVISEPGEPLRFVHSSSARKESGVKVSQVDSTRYETRLLGIRRVIEDTTVGRATPGLSLGLVPAALPAVTPPVVVPKPARAPRVGAARHHARVRAKAPRVRGHAAKPAAKKATTSAGEKTVKKAAKPAVKPVSRLAPKKAVKKAVKKPVKKTALRR